MSKFDELPPALKAKFLENGRAMQRFYTLPTEQRQFILDRIHKLNSSEEMKDYIDSLF